ncbi:hypothetical protein J5N97_008807 [Dioscorea zingiberensis]|uniref:Coenzyme Q-binding protein COQ10 START domain-containing protein n=1 Tax=Dioscorea zingiberensis TaxID=325984 RepID=A0A9D5HLQ7_9LILI|nr:hypothetical protein J5N97_008807 [Dioscorea zingiberensis]
MAARAAFISGPCSLSHFKGVEKEALFHPLRTFFGKPYPNKLFLRSSSNGIKRRSFFIPIRPFSPVMEWQDCSTKLDVDVPCSVAYECYSDRELIPKWMPFISSVKILEDKPDLSRWSLKYEVLGRDVEFSWLARNMQPIPNQKIHWRSLEGLANRGAVRFFPKGPSSCRIELSISYEVPQILVPVASALKPLLESLLLNGLERFAKVAKGYKKKASLS